MSQIGPDAGGPDSVDKNDPVILEGVGENDKVGLPTDLEVIPGYSVAGGSLPPPMPPLATNIPDKASYKQPEMQEVPVISHERAKKALLDHIETQCCWGKGTANKITTFENLESSTTYHYTLETFTETRSTQWQMEPFRGQFIDGPENGIPVHPWGIPLTAVEQFRDFETRSMEVPHTASVRPCHRCQAGGFLICAGCEGRGRLYCGMCKGKGRRQQRVKDSQGVWRAGVHNCDVCSGSGKKPCSRCNGTARVTCPSCQGQTKLKWYIQLLVTWKTYKGDHAVGKSNVPKVLVTRVPGTIAFEDVQPMLYPITKSPDPEIMTASTRLLAEQKFPHSLILMQRHKIKVVPVTKCEYRYNNRLMSYYVYGLDCRVHAPDYPDQCCVIMFMVWIVEFMLLIILTSVVLAARLCKLFDS